MLGGAVAQNGLEGHITQIRGGRKVKGLDLGS